MNEDLITALLEQGEGTTVDFKKEQYPIGRGKSGVDSHKMDPAYFEKKKSELLKDVLAMVNSFRERDSYILIGVRDCPGGAAEVLGVNREVVQDDADLQQFIAAHSEKPIVFDYRPVRYRGHTIVVLRIPLAQVAHRPFQSRTDYGVVRRGITYIRQGSHTEVAGTEILRAIFAAESSAPKVAPPQAYLLDRNRNRTQNLLVTFQQTHVLDSASLPDFVDPRGWLMRKLGGPLNPNFWRDCAAIARVYLNSVWVELEIVNTSDIHLTGCTLQVEVTTPLGQPAPAHNHMPGGPSPYGDQSKWTKNYERFIAAQKCPSGDWQSRELSAKDLRPGDKSGLNSGLLLYFGEHRSLNVHYKVLAKELGRPAEGVLVVSTPEGCEEWSFDRLKAYISNDQLRFCPRDVRRSD